MGAPADRTYTTKELADLAGVSSRTLRYYDQIGLLVPARAANGYRVYDAADMHRLQHILLLRSCGVPLESIEDALDRSDFDLASMLREHLTLLCRQRKNWMRPSRRRESPWQDWRLLKKWMIKNDLNR